MGKKQNKECCPLCGKPLSGDKEFGGYMANLLKLCLEFACRRTVSWREKYDDKNSPLITRELDDIVTAEDFSSHGLTTQYTRIADLCYWGLLSRNYPDWRHQGIYQVTQRAKDFVLGRVMVRKIAVVSGGHLIQFEGESLTFDMAMARKKKEIADWINEWRGKHEHDKRQDD